MKKLILLVGIIILSSLAYAEVCEPKSTFKERLQDKCSYNNTICEDGEYPFLNNAEDCKLTTESITCKGDRCIFTELWFAKLLLIVLAYFLISYKKDYNVFIVLIIVLLALNFSNLPLADSIKHDLTNMSPVVNKSAQYIPQENINDNIAMRYGQKIWPPNPMYGFFALLIVMFFIVRYIFKRWWT